MNEELATSPAGQGGPPNPVKATPPEVDSIPRVLVWSMGGLAAALLLVGSGVLLLRWWDSLHVGIRGGCLVLPLLLMWGGYAWAAKRGVRSAEAVGAFASISWLLLLLGWQTLYPAAPHWLPGGLFVLGALLVAVFFPNRTSVMMLGVASVVVMALLWYQTTNGWTLPTGLPVWAGVVAVLCLWGLAGFLCGLSRHAVYAPYAFLGPLMFSVYLLVLQGVILYLPSMPEVFGRNLLWVAGLWLAPTLVFCVVHRLRAVRSGRPGLSLAFLATLGSMYAVLPVGLWANQVLPMIPGVLLLIAYAVSLVYYGSVYKSTYYVVAGCVLAFSAALGVSFGHGGSPLAGGICMLVLGGAFAWFACRLYSRRKQLIVAITLLNKRREAEKKCPPTR